MSCRKGCLKTGAGGNGESLREVLAKCGQDLSVSTGEGEFLQFIQRKPAGNAWRCRGHFDGDEMGFEHDAIARDGMLDRDE